MIPLVLLGAYLAGIVGYIVLFPVLLNPSFLHSPFYLYSFCSDTHSKFVKGRGKPWVPPGTNLCISIKYNFDFFGGEFSFHSDCFNISIISTDVSKLCSGLNQIFSSFEGVSEFLAWNHF